MKRFAREFVAFAAIQVAVGAVVLSFARTDDSHYLAATRDKHKLLAAAPSPRIIFVGGSSVAMGLDCSVIKRRLAGYNPVNMGLHLTLGLEFMLAEVEANLRPADVVVLSLEYNALLADQGNYILLQVAELRPASLAYVKWSKASDLGLNYLGRLVRRGVKGIQGRAEFTNDPPYVRRAFNEYGDMTMHWNMPRPELVRMGLEFNESSPRYMAKMIKRLNQFHRYCRRRGVTVLFVYPPFADKHFHQQREVVDKIEAALAESLTIPILNRPADAVQPIDRFFDTSYHLFGQGVPQRSRQMADLLAKRLDK